MTRTLKLLGLTLLTSITFAACHHDDYTPKPTAYLRIDLPKASYSLYDTTALPFTFEQSTIAQVVWKKNDHNIKWIDIVYPPYKGFVFLTYKPLRGPQDLAGQIDTSYEMVKKHFGHSSGMDENRFVDPTHKVYATTYMLKGQNVASTYQFWITDSTHHFVRGSFYIDCKPNNDSLAPVLEYLQHDINHLLETLRWKQ